MVEFVIVLPIMLFLIFLIAFAGIGFERYMRVTNAARVAARAAAVARFEVPSTPACDAAQAAADDAMNGLATTMADCVEGPPGSTVTVTLEYTLPSIPMISSITGPITVSGTATERRE
jgi:Flp pilus assembly protein TadG